MFWFSCISLPHFIALLQSKQDIYSAGKPHASFLLCHLYCCYSSHMEKKKAGQPVHNRLQSHYGLIIHFCLSITPSHNTTWHLVPLAGPEGKQLPERRNNNTQKTSACAGWGHWHAWLCVPVGFHRGHMPAWICWGAWACRAQSPRLLVAVPYPPPVDPPASLAACLPSLAMAALSEQTRARLSEQLFVWVNSLLPWMRRCTSMAPMLRQTRGWWLKTRGPTPIWCLPHVIAQLSRWRTPSLG